jgi:hypothetical protein
MKKITAILALFSISIIVRGQITTPYTTISEYNGINDPNDGIYTPGLFPGRIHIVILSDGYAASPTNNYDGPIGFNNDANDFIAVLLATPPFSEYRDYFRIFKVFVPSPNVGIAHTADASCGEPTTTSSTTLASPSVFGSHYDSQSTNDDGTTNTLHRLLVPDDAGDVSDYVLNNFNILASSPIITTTIILANSQIYGGSGNYRIGNNPGETQGIAIYGAKFSTTGGANGGHQSGTGDENATIHEFGHSFGNLLDEYWHATREIPNDITSPLLVAPNKAFSASGLPTVWDHWGPFPTQAPDHTYTSLNYYYHRHMEDVCAGQYGYGTATSDTELEYYKPTSRTTPSNSNSANCRMESITQPFCSVCREAIIERIHKLVPDPVLTISPTLNTSGNPITLNTTTPQTFSFTLIEPIPQTSALLITPINTHYMRVEWYLNNITADDPNALIYTTQIPDATTHTWDFTLDCSYGLKIWK